MKAKLPQKNEFFDINKLPGDEGVLLFPLSMSKLPGAHSPVQLAKDLEFFQITKLHFLK